MSGQLTEENRPLLDRCLVVIFKEKKSKNVDTVVNDYEVPVSIKNDAPNPLDNINTRGSVTDKLNNASNNSNGPPKSLSGRELYDEFVLQNKGCFWDPHLEESLNNLQVLGYLFPHTVLIGGRDIYLDTVRSAWGRRVLQSPANYTLHKIGELHNVSMQLVAQAQFTPLPEALCMIISDINKGGNIPATFEEILKHLKKKYKNVHQPSEEIVYEALGNLLKERKIYHTGHGYHIITPELFAHLNHINGFATLQECGVGNPVMVNPLMMPVASLPVTEMSSIACQTEAVEEHQPDKENIHSKKLLRSNSMRETKKSASKEKKGLNESFCRSTSLRLDQEKAKGLVKDINLKTSELHQEKEKADKTSLLSKIFGSGKGKKKNQLHQQLSIPEEQLEDSVEENTVEYATFSAQFPPPDLKWYEAQARAAMLLQKPPLPAQRQVSKSGTFHHLQRPNMVDAESQSDFFEDEYPFQHCPIHKSKTLPENITGLADGYHSQSRLRSSSSHSQDSRNSKGESMENNLNSSETKALSKYNKCKRYQDRSREAEERDKYRGSVPNDSIYIVQTNAENYDSNEKCNSQLKSRRILSPKEGTEGIYEDIADMKKNVSNKRNSSAVGDVAPISIRHDNVEVEASNAYTNGTKPPLPLKNKTSKTNDRGFKNSSHKNRVYKRYKEMYCGSSVACKDDISIEYNGSMPGRASAVAKSQDSGVNCIGLPELHPCVTIPLSEGSNSLDCSVDGEQDCNEKQKVGNSLRYSEFQQSFGQGMDMTSTPYQCVYNTRDSGAIGTSDLVTHQAEIHKIPEERDLHGMNNINEDSGFNSPHQGNLSYSPYSYGQPLGNSFTQQHHRQSNRQDFSEKPVGHSDSAGSGKCVMNNNNHMNSLFYPNGDINTSVQGFIETDLDHPSLDAFPREGSPTQNEDGEITPTPRAFQLLPPETVDSKLESKKTHSRHHEKRGKYSKKERPKSVRDDRGHDVHIQENSKIPQHNGLSPNMWTIHNAHILDNKHCSRRSLTQMDKQKIESSLHKKKQGDFEVVGVV